MISFIASLASAIPHSKGGIAAPQRSQPIYKCAHGYQLQGKKCIRDISEAANLFCPPGFMQQGSGKSLSCTKSAARVSRCPAGALAEGKNCYIDEFASMIANCPQGYQDMGKQCVRQIQLPMVPRCEIGQLIGNECIQIDSTALIKESFCPAGYFESSKGCEKSITYDCSPPGKKGGAMGNPKLRFLGHKDHGSYASNFGKKGAPAPKIAVVQQMCKRSEFAPRVKSARCPAGYMQAGKGCSKKIIAQPIMVCSKGGLDQAMCYTEEIVAPIRSCPNGYLNRGAKCARRQNIPMESFCPAGMIDSGKGCSMSVPAQMRCKDRKSVV